MDIQLKGWQRAVVGQDERKKCGGTRREADEQQTGSGIGVECME